MAVCRVVETGATPEQYERVTERLGVSDRPPPGVQVHLALLTGEGKVRVLEVWGSREEAERFTQTVSQARRDVGMDWEPAVEYLEAHRVLQA